MRLGWGGTGSTLGCWWHRWVLSTAWTRSGPLGLRAMGGLKSNPPRLSLPPLSQATLQHPSTHAHMCKYGHACKHAHACTSQGAQPPYRALPGHHLIQFLGNPDQLLSRPHAGGSRLAGLRRSVEQNRGGGRQSWVLPAWGFGHRWEGGRVRSGSWAGKEQRRGGKKGKRKGREGRESRKEVGLSRPVINSCQAGELARGRAKYS